MPTAAHYLLQSLQNHKQLLKEALEAQSGGPQLRPGEGSMQPPFIPLRDRGCFKVHAVDAARKNISFIYKEFYDALRNATADLTCDPTRLHRRSLEERIKRRSAHLYHYKLQLISAWSCAHQSAAASLSPRRQG